MANWTRPDIADLIAQEFGYRYHVSSQSKILRVLGFSRQKMQLSYPNANPRGPCWKEELPEVFARVAIAHPHKRSTFRMKADSAKKGRFCRRRWLRASDRARGSAPQFRLRVSATEPLTKQDFCLILPVVSANAMSEFVRRFSASLPVDEHALDGRRPGRLANQLRSRGPIQRHAWVAPRYSPESTPPSASSSTSENGFSGRVCEGYTAVLDAVADAWRQVNTNQSCPTAPILG